MDSHQRFVCNKPNVIYEVFADEAVLINMVSGNYYSLNPTAARIWTALEKGASAPEIGHDLRRRYANGPADVGSAVAAFLEELRREGLIVADGQALAVSPDVIPDSDTAKPPFVAPALQRFSDMQDLLLLDPIHEVDETGWPNRPPQIAQD